MHVSAACSPMPLINSYAAHIATRLYRSTDTQPPEDVETRQRVLRLMKSGEDQGVMTRLVNDLLMWLALMAGNRCKHR